MQRSNWSSISNAILKMVLTVAAVGAIAYALICLALLKWQTRLIFVPSPTIQGTPKDRGLDYEEVWLSVPTQKETVERLHGWWLPAASQSENVLLYLHGNGENISANIVQAQPFHQAGLDIFLFDYRGYGKSEGDFPHEEQVYEDAQVALNYLIEQRGISPQNIIVYGHSLGGAIAIELTWRNPNLAGLIVESSFTSMRKIVGYSKVYRLFPSGVILHQKFDSIEKIKSLKMPLLLIHGTDDTTVPHFMSQELFDAATEPKQFLSVPDAGHNDVATVGGSSYLEAVRDFLQQVKQPQGQPH
ncbi:alpha/beta hydrolase [Lusitaniella coriacea LEGE 07157]|uniref:Alpha/beta hydrolase n=2 Tax=Lusitaniella TaxID=1983104 RepID=A0A8J7JC12_9CYAN|nr:alpha/beta hydrolase [Lusitaniella coriacea LEGE 07157]